MVKKLILTLLLIIIPTLCFAGPPSPKEVSDEAYNADTWDGVKNKAPSKNAVRDVIEGLAGGHDSVTLSTDADAILSLVAQEIGVDNQSANTVLAGPAEGVADAPTFRSLVPADIPDISATYQPTDADLTTYAGITPSANVQSLMGAATYAAMRTLLDLEAGTDFYSMTAADTAFESDLNNSAGLLAALSDETGTGVAVFGTSPTLTTPTISGAITNDEGALTNDTILEADLKAVDAASDEDILTYESTTGDFEWHTIDEVLANATSTGADLIASLISAGALGASVVQFPDIDLEADDFEASGTTVQLVAEIPHTDVAETITGEWAFPALKLTAKTSAPGSPVGGHWYRANGVDWDPGGLSLGYDYFNIYNDNSTSYITNFDERGTLHVSTLTTVETEILPIGYADDGTSAPAAAAVLSSTNSAMCRAFDGASNEDLDITWHVPADIDTTSGVKFRFIGYVGAATAPANTEVVAFSLAGCSIGNSDLLSCAAGSAQTSSLTADATYVQYDRLAGAYSSAITITNLTAGESVHMDFIRLATTTDTYAQDFHVNAVEIKYKRQHNATF